MYFNWISTASFITSNKRGSKTCFNCNFGNTKLIEHRFIKPLLCRISASEKIKVVFIEHLKQTLSLYNN